MGQTRGGRNRGRWVDWEIGRCAEEMDRVLKKDTLDAWDISRATEVYGVENWGNGFFSISPEGEVCVRLRHGRKVFNISLLDVVKGVRERGLDLPILLRFGDILESRIAVINESFKKAITESGYKAPYRGVYPIKVNQQQEVVEQVARFGRKYHHGLEAGSKAELIAALAYMHDPQAYIVCNGYKDEEFIDLALSAQMMGLSPLLVLEIPGELDLILRQAEKRGIRPHIGVRLKLSTRAGGRWSDSGGDRTVFGLTPSQVIDVVDQLREREMLDCLNMLHYHLGSQIPNITHVRAAITEAARFYVDLVAEGAPMGILDIGGGLAVDYDGSHTNFSSSSNYGLDEYCVDIVEGIMTAVDAVGIPHPTIISESGRATVAYSSVLLFNVLEVAKFEYPSESDAQLPEEAPEVLRNMLEVFSVLSPKNVQECYHDAIYYRQEIKSAFLHGSLSLRDRALGDKIFWAILTRLATETRKLKYVPEELRGLENALADVYYANFSVFQSLPDAWAVEQLFPIMPIQRLNERPSRIGTLSDITCDCDGKIDRFIDLHDVKRVLPMHDIRPGEEDYILGTFLVGAYQETLGDLHNLFGDTNVVGIDVDEDGEIEYTSELQGDSVSDVLSYVEYSPADLVDRVRRLAESAVRKRKISATERRDILNAYENGLRGYTYFEN